MWYVDAPGEAFVKSLEVDIARVSKGVLIAFFPFHHPFHNGFGGIMAAEAGTVQIHLTADTKVEQLQEQYYDQ